MGDQLSKSCSDQQQLSYIEQNENHPSHFDIVSTQRKPLNQQNREPLPSTGKKITKFNHQRDQEAVTLRIQVIASATLQDGIEFHMTSRGLKGSAQEGEIIFFGCKKKNVKHGYQINDIVIPCLDKGLAEKHRGQHFYIKHTSRGYKIKDLGTGFGCFRRINEISLKHLSLLTIGSLYIVAFIGYGQEILTNPTFNNLYDVKEFFVAGYPCDRNEFLKQSRNQSYLKLNIYGGHAKDENYLFSSLNNLPITIGRSYDCLIRYSDDALISKYQCTVYFDGSWKLMDGIEGRSSTNGTWSLIQEEMDIEDGMQIKNNNTILQLSLI